jgi:WD40 repeat protein
VVTAPGYLAVGIAGGEGQVVVYDDEIFQQIHTICHGDHVGGLTFAESGKYLASLCGKTVRVWSPATGLELASFELPLKCSLLRFAKQDTILRVVMERNHFVEWDIKSQAFVQDEPVCWGADLPQRMRGRLPTQVWLSPNTDLLAALYQGHDVIFWDCAGRMFYDVYEQKTGSVQLFGSHLQARGWPTVRAATFSQAADIRLFAATFDDGDLVVFDLDIGKPIAVNTERTYNLVLASSHDGRTLAGVDQLGNLTLFEFQTLRLLYRVRLEASTLPWGLTFTGDDLRIIETSQGQCRVWEPPVLRSHNTQLDCVSLTELKSMSPRDMYRDCQARRAQEITAMTCSHAFSVVFYAMGDGSVYGYDILGPEPEKKVLFVQGSHSEVVALYFDDQGKILACGDRRENFSARRINRRRVRPEQVETVWEVDPPLIEVRRSGPGLGTLKQVLVSSRHQRLLAGTENHCTLWEMPHQAGKGSLCQITYETSRESTNPLWKTCLCPRSAADLLLSVEETGQGIKIYDWESLSLLRVVPLLPGLHLSLDGFGPLSHTHYFAMYATDISAPKPHLSNKETAAILVWNFQDLEGTDSQPVAPRWEIRTSMLPAQVVHLIGAFDTRLVFHTADHWITSLELMPPGSSTGAIVAEDSFVRHFFLPNSWIGPMKLSDMLFGISSEGEIIFDRQGELAVIKRGLEVTEEGEPFQPRQLSSTSRAQFGHKIPYRQPGMSVTCRLQTQDSGCLVDREG